MRLDDPDQRSDRHTLALRVGALGDTVLAVPALRALSERGGSLTVVASPPLTPLLASQRWIDRVVSVEAPEVAALFAPGPSALDEPFRATFADVTHAVVWLRVPAPVAARARALGIHAVMALPSYPTDASDAHLADHLLATINAPTGRAPTLDVGSDERAEAQRLLSVAETARPIMLHVGAGGPAKRWPVAHLADLARRLLDRGHQVALLSGPTDDRELAATRALVSSTTTLPPIPMALLPAVLAEARAFVGADSGPAHVAAAVGAPTIVLFGPTDPSRWRPRGPCVTVLIAGQGEMATISPGAVEQAVLTALADSAR